MVIALFQWCKCVVTSSDPLCSDHVRKESQFAPALPQHLLNGLDARQIGRVKHNMCQMRIHYGRDGRPVQNEQLFNELQRARRQCRMPIPAATINEMGQASTNELTQSSNSDPHKR